MSFSIALKIAFIEISHWILPFFNPFRADPGRREKFNLNFYFHTSLWCLKIFYDGLKGLHKTIRSTTEKCENKDLS